MRFSNDLKKDISPAALFFIDEIPIDLARGDPTDGDEVLMSGVFESGFRGGCREGWEGPTT
jgi:hypothetical protein